MNQKAKWLKFDPNLKYYYTLWQIYIAQLAFFFWLLIFHKFGNIWPLKGKDNCKMFSMQECCVINLVQNQFM